MQGYKDDPDPQESFALKDCLLYRNNKLCITKGDVRNKILNDYHSTPSSSHLGEVKTRNTIFPLYYWKDYREAVRNFVSTCRTCQLTESRNHKPFSFLKPSDPPGTIARCKNEQRFRRYNDYRMQVIQNYPLDTHLAYHNGT